jgi:plastocyanin
MRKALAVLAAGALAAFGLAACGGSSNNDSGTTAASTTTQSTAAGGGGAGGTVNISAAADNSFSFDQKDVTSPAGTVTVDFNNPASLSHDVVVADSSGTVLGKTDLVSQGQASTTVDLQPGTYTFYCDVPGHRQGGMEGTLTVK